MQILLTIQMWHSIITTAVKGTDSTSGLRLMDSPHRRKIWGMRVVSPSVMSDYDWERGTRDEDDFWDFVER